MQNIAGISYCTALLQSYSWACGSETLCLNSFRKAMADAGTYFKQAGAGATTGFQLVLPPGILNFLHDASTDSSSTIIPLPLATANSATPPGANARLVIAGAGMNEQAGGTEVLYRHTQLFLSGTNISHVTVTGIHFATDYAAVGQGFLVSATKVNQVVGGRTYPTSALTIQMQNFPAAGFYNLAGGFAAGGVFNDGRDYGRFLKSYENILSPTGIYTPVVSANPDNYQISFHDICNDTQAKSCVSTTKSLTSSTLTFLLGSKAGRSLTPYESSAYGWFQGLAASGQKQFICMKEAGANGGFSHITASPGNGSDIVFDHLTWTEAAHAQFQGISGVTITNSAVQREPPAAIGDGTYQLPCLSTDTGAMQIHGPTFGNIVQSYTAEATGDDSLAIQGDTGGSEGFAASSVTSSLIENSFDRGVLITSVKGDPTPYTATISVRPYVEPGSGGAPYAQTPGSCSGIPGDNCIQDVFVPCPYPAATMHGPSVYCPVKVQPDS